MAAVGEHDHGNVHAPADRLRRVGGLGGGLDVDLGPLDAEAVEEGLGSAAVAAPVGAVHGHVVGSSSSGVSHTGCNARGRRSVPAECRRLSATVSSCDAGYSAVMALTEIVIPQPADPRGGEHSAVLSAVLGVPEGEGPFVPLVVVHEVFGIDDAMRDHLERLTRMGYLVLMPNLFSRGGARRCLVATFRALRSGTGAAFDDIEAARTLLLARDDTTKQVGVIGFCMGGGFALLLAGQGDFGAASVNYGMLPADLDDTLDGACPIVGTFGGRDRTLRGAAEKLESALVARGIEHDVVEYPEAGHAFLNAHPAGSAVTRVMMKPMMGSGHRPVEAEDAWQRIDTFFARTLV